jgi:hypothetical protein
MVSVQRVFMSFCLGVLSLAASAATAHGGGANPDARILQVPLPVMVAAVTGWVAADLGETVPGEMPAVAFMDRAEMRVIRQPKSPPPFRDTDSDTLEALYMDESHTIVLPTGWSGATPAEVSILVHEVVHHFQALRGDIHACPAAREKLAFEVQGRWLEAHGESLQSAFGLDGFDLLVATNCMF